MVRIKNPIRESRDGEKGSCARLKDRGKKFLENFGNTFQGHKAKPSQNMSNTNKHSSTELKII